jgi:hypothetical protein
VGRTAKSGLLKMAGFDKHVSILKQLIIYPLLVKKSQKNQYLLLDDINL